MSFIPLMSPNITDEDIEAAVRVLRSGMLVQGENVAQLEQVVADYLGVRNVVAAANGTATLQIGLKSLGIGPGDQVIVPAFSHVATANVVELVGAECVFVDIELPAFNIDVSQIEDRITSRTRAIVPVHEFGLMCEIVEIVEIARKHNLFVIEDAACALGARLDGKLAGGFGIAGSFSLHPRKAITSGEGGLLVTDDNDLAARWRILRNHGIDDRTGKQRFVEAGFNYRMTDFQAALALSQFRRLERNLCAKRKLASVYLSELKDEKKILLPSSRREENHTWQTFHILLDDSCNRDLLIERLRSRGIGTNYGAQCIPALDYYRRKYRLDIERLFPNSAAAFRRGLALPLYEKMTEENARTVANILRDELAG